MSVEDWSIKYEETPKSKLWRKTFEQVVENKGSNSMTIMEIENAAKLANKAVDCYARKFPREKETP